MARRLVDHGLPAPVLEHGIVDERGELVAQVDLAYPAQRVVIELQSKRWHLNHRNFDADPARWNRLTVLGWRVFPVTWTAFAGQPLDLCRLIARALTTPPPDHHPTAVELLTQRAAGGVPRHKVARPLNF